MAGQIFAGPYYYVITPYREIVFSSPSRAACADWVLAHPGHGYIVTTKP